VTTPGLARPLDGVRIVDFSTVLSGPIASGLLADQGADVIKIESPEGDTCRQIGPAKGDLSAMYITINRGKRSLAIDLKAPAARPVLAALLRWADVALNNFRPGVMERLGLTDDAMATTNPRLVRASITGYGPDGPAAGDKVYDAVIQAAAGVCASHRDHRTGEPTLLSTAVCDKLTALTAAQAITAALFARERDGQGRRIEVSMLDAALAFQWPDAMYNHVFLDEPPAHFPEFGANNRPWKTADGFVTSMNPQQSEFIALCQALGRPDLPQDPRFTSLPSRGRHAKELRALLEEPMSRMRTDELIAACRAAGAPVARINERGEVIADPQVQHNQALVEIDQGRVGRVRLPRSAARFDGKPMLPQAPAAHLGQHTREVLQALGLPPAQIDRLIDDGVARQA